MIYDISIPKTDTKNISSFLLLANGTATSFDFLHLFVSSGDKLMYPSYFYALLIHKACHLFKGIGYCFGEIIMFLMETRKRHAAKVVKNPETFTEEMIVV